MPIKLGGSNNRKPSGPRQPRTRKTMNEILLGNLSETNVSSHGNYSSDVRQYNNWQTEEPVDEQDNAMDDDFNAAASLGQSAAFDAAMPLDQGPPFEQSAPFAQSDSNQPEFDWSGTHISPEPTEFSSELPEERPWLPDDAGEKWIPNVGSDWAESEASSTAEAQAPGQSHDEAAGEPREQTLAVESSLEPSQLELAYGMVESANAHEPQLSEVSKLALAEPSVDGTLPPPEASYFTASFLEEQDVDHTPPPVPISVALPAGEIPLVAALRIAFASGIQPGVAGNMPSLAPTNAAFSLPPRPLPETVVAAVASFAPTNVSFSAGVPSPAAVESPLSKESTGADATAVSDASAGCHVSESQNSKVEEIPTFDLGDEPIGEVVIFEESLHGGSQTANGVEQAAPLSDIYRTRRGTIELVIHKDGRMITPQYNNCGILTGVDLGNGSTLQRPAAGGFWRVLDAEGVEQPSIDIKAVTFDKHGTLWAITAAGDRLKVSSDGFDAK